MNSLSRACVRTMAPEKVGNALKEKLNAGVTLSRLNIVWTLTDRT